MLCGNSRQWPILVYSLDERISKGSCEKRIKDMSLQFANGTNDESYHGWGSGI